MSNILVNGLKSKVGGGKIIFDTYLRLLAESEPDDTYFVLTPDRCSYASFESDNIKIIDIPRWAHSNLATLPLYRFIMPNLLNNLGIDAILNFGDIVIPTDVHQVYNFDWAFAVYPNHAIWGKLPLRDKVFFRLKLHFFEAYLRRAAVIMAQTQAMKSRLEARYRLDNVVLVPAAVTVAEASSSKKSVFDLPKGRFKFVYPANYYPHKNIDILERVAAELKARDVDVVIVLTIDPKEHEAAGRFLDRIKCGNLDDVLINVGRVSAEYIPALYQACDALLMPTLLETFGLPYVEAMDHRKPIVTSDMDFAHAVCGEAALYCDPMDPLSILAAMERVWQDEEVRASLVTNGVRRLSAMWDWPRVFAEYQSLVMQGLAGRSPIGEQGVASS
ncbi:glycosyltransferase [Sphingomonas cannabina]|uniref:glycosyltransferase n=1 Tax=Sphingomonas cannabina TaxID=2899123 RepID=UPI001F30E43F|nr:glycosyltransferase [Sphingomonas cannabina]UIJ44436.1 glycosyltransferase [Sphingomonas cannabina]